MSLGSTRGRERSETRTCVVLSPDVLNDHLATYLVAPMTIGGHPYPFRIPCSFQNRDGFILLDQLRTVDRASLVRRLSQLSAPTLDRALGVLQEMFAE